MQFTFFPPASPLPPAHLSNADYAAAHCRQTKPGQVFDLPTLADVAEWVVASQRPGRKGDAGYIIAGACNTTRKEGGPSPFCLVDYDDGAPDWAALDAYSGFAWTTASHTAEKPAWRVLVLFKEPIAHGRLQCPFPGGHIRNRTQPAFLPTGDAVEYRALEGTQRLDGGALGSAAAEYEARESSMLGAAFQAAGWVIGKQHNGLIVRCPWTHEHSDRKPGGSVVFHDDDDHSGMGHFVCARTKCTHRTSSEALEVIRGIPAAAAELAHWPEPTNVLVPYERVEEVAPVPAEPAAAWVTGAALAAPVGDVAWLVKALELAPGRAPILSADSGVGKSWAVQSLALSVASGQLVFGHFPCRQGTVLHIAEDSDLEAVRDRYQKLARGMALNLAELDLAVYGKQFRVTRPDGKYDAGVLEKVRTLAAQQNAALVIFDSLATICVGLNENDPEIALPLYGSRDSQVCMLWTHHTPKNGDGYRGSSAIKAAAGAMWTMTEGEKVGTRLWTSAKHAERTDSKERLDSFHTTWDGQKISVVADEPQRTQERACDRAQLAMLRLLDEQNKADKATLLRAAGGATGRAGTLNRAVFDFLANPLGGQITQVERGRFVLAAGVVVPKHAHQLQAKLPEEVVRGLSAPLRHST